MRVAIVGTHSTGKTTLLESLSGHLDLPILSEVAREKIAESDKLPHLMTEIERGEFQKLVLEEQMRRESSSGRFIADRSVFDAVAYAFDTPHYDALRIRAGAHASAFPYDRVFFLPIEFPLKGDGIRSEDEAYRETVDRELRKLLDRAEIPYETVRGNREERLWKCLGSLGIDM